MNAISINRRIAAGNALDAIGSATANHAASAMGPLSALVHDLGFLHRSTCQIPGTPMHDRDWNNKTSPKPLEMPESRDAAAFALFGPPGLGPVKEPPTAVYLVE